MKNKISVGLIFLLSILLGSIWGKYSIQNAQAQTPPPNCVPLPPATGGIVGGGSMDVSKQGYGFGISLINEVNVCNGLPSCNLTASGGSIYLGVDCNSTIAPWGNSTCTLGGFNSGASACSSSNPGCPLGNISCPTNSQIRISNISTISTTEVSVTFLCIAN